MHLVGLMQDDIADSENGIAVSVWVAGCPLQCKGCHNPQLWDHESVPDISVEEVVANVKMMLHANGVERHLSILGGEPLAPYNVKDVCELLQEIRREEPELRVLLWTGYTVEALPKETKDAILPLIDVLIDGPYIEDLRNAHLPLRGSSNQRVFDVDRKSKTLKERSN